jgi:hypothetical protein
VRSSSTRNSSLVARAGISGSSPLVGSLAFSQVVGETFDGRLRPPMLVYEVESNNYLVSTRFEAFLAPHTGVFPYATGDGIYTPRW